MVLHSAVSAARQQAVTVRGVRNMRSVTVRRSARRQLPCATVRYQVRRGAAAAAAAFRIMLTDKLLETEWGLLQTSFANLDDWLTVHRSITLVDLQLDAQNSYLFTYNTFIKILYMFRALP